MKEDKGAERQSLITNSERGSVNVKPTPKIRLDTIIVFVFIVVMLVLMCISFYGFITEDHQVAPTRVAIPWYADRPIVMELGTSRVFQPNLYSGNDNRAYNNFQQVTKREIEWSVDPAGIATVDMYGRVNAIKEGECKLKLKSLANPEATDERTIKVVTKRTDIDKVPKRVINFKGEPADTLKSLQKLVERMSAAEALKDPLTPTTVKYAIEHLDQKYSDTVIDGTITWTITQYADKSDKQYILRTDSDKNDTDRDKLQYFIGDRYLPDAGNSVLMIESDKNNGLWVVGASGNVTHIKMVVMNYRDKAETMNDMTEQFVMRQGLASGASFDGTKWVPEVSDNDGLWTSMYGAGELMKYSVLREKKADPAVVAKARERALKSLKAVLLTANVAGRQGKIPARIRHLNNTRSRLGPKYSKEYLLKGKYNIRDIYSGIPADGNGLYGNDAGKVVDGEYISGRFKYSMLPLNKNDWGTTGAAATTERTLDGFMSRTFVIPAVGPSVPDSGLFFRRHSNGTHSVLSGAHNLYDYERTDHPDLQLGSKPIPQVLKSILNINGVQYDVDDLVYKGDTSTDEVIGHLFIYKIAYDILDENNEQQNQLKQLIRQTMRNFCQHLINNGYILADATGQATTWSKLYKQFFTTDYTTQDTSLKIIQLLLSFKVAYYVTGQKKWKDQYDLLTLDPQFRYIDIYSHVWDKWIWLYTKCDDLQDKLFRFNSTMAPSDIELERHLLYQFHFSDEEEAYLAYYLIFQLEENPQLREQFRYGLDAYWHSISKSENPLWYYIYQLASPDKPVKDSFDQDLRQVSAWQLSRHMIDTREYQAYVKGSRPDVIHEGPISVNPFKVVGKRTNTEDEKYVNTPENKKTFPNFNPNNIYEVKALPADERSIHKFNGATFENIYNNHNPNSMQPSTTYTLPYWLGVYHNLIKLD